MAAYFKPRKFFLQSPQKQTTSPCPEPDKSNPHPLTLFKQNRTSLLLRFGFWFGFPFDHEEGGSKSIRNLNHLLSQHSVAHIKVCCIVVISTSSSSWWFLFVGFSDCFSVYTFLIPPLRATCSACTRRLRAVHQCTRENLRAYTASSGACRPCMSASVADQLATAALLCATLNTKWISN
jgi:hypothetical protein